MSAAHYIFLKAEALVYFVELRQQNLLSSIILLDAIEEKYGRDAKEFVQHVREVMINS